MWADFESSGLSGTWCHFEEVPNVPLINSKIFPRKRLPQHDVKVSR